jgi:thioredoxin reductase
MLAVVGGGAAADAAAVRAGRAGARLSSGATAELRLHGFIELSVSLVVFVFL